MKKPEKLSPKNEFYTLLPTIRSIYESGIVVGKTIYDRLKKDGKIEMRYQRFAEYFRKEISGKTDLTPKKEDEPAAQSTGSNTTEPAEQNAGSETQTPTPQTEPLILRGENVRKTSFTPHTRGIDEADIL